MFKSMIMKNDYHNNIRRIESNNLEKNLSKTKIKTVKTSEINTVDINKLLNRIKITEKKKNIEKITFSGLIIFILIAVGFISSL